MPKKIVSFRFKPGSAADQAVAKALLEAEREKAGYTWTQTWKREGDDMACPKCGKQQVETQDKVTACLACGWTANNPVAH